jgi:hypothetical protein
MNNPLRPRPSIGRFISPICLPASIAINKCFESAYFRNESRNGESEFGLTDNGTIFLTEQD